MSAPVTVIIPTLNAAPHLGPLLVALTEASVAGLIREVILADGGSSDDIAQLAEAVGARFLPCPRGRGAQMAAGAAMARGTWLLFLHADSRPEAGWIQAIEQHLGTNHKAGWFHLRFDAEGFAARFVAAWANFRARVFDLPFGDQGLLIPTALYRQLGSHPPLPLMEDVALARRLRGQLCPLPAYLTTSARRYQQQGWWRRGARNLWLQCRYFMGTDPTVLARAYDPGQTAPQQHRGEP